MRRILLLLLTALLALAPALSLAEGKSAHYTCDGWKYRLQDDGTARITNWSSGTAETLVIPDMLDGHPVTTLGTTSILGRNLREVTIPDSIVAIEGNPFSFCENLMTIHVSAEHPALEVVNGMLFDRESRTLLCHPQGLQPLLCVIPEGTRSIGFGALSDCSAILMLVLPDSLVSIDQLAFANCSGLTTVILPEQLEQIGATAFQRCVNLKRVHLPASLTDIHDFAFFKCSSDLTFHTTPGSYAEAWVQTQAAKAP